MRPDPKHRLLARFGFGPGEDGTRLLGPGWSAPEPGFVWSDAAASHLNVPVPPRPPGADAGEVFLRLTLRPFVAPPQFPAQRVRLSLQGETQDEERLCYVTCLGYRLAGAGWGRGGELRLQFDLPDSSSPRAHGDGDDPRRLGVAISELSLWRAPPALAAAHSRRPPLPVATFDFGEAARAALRGLTALSPRELMLQFESLGHNCEFGLLQRRCEAEPMSLLRFASITPERLIAALDCGFAGVDDPQLLQITVEGAPRPEYVLGNASFGMLAHSFRYPDETAEADVRNEQIRKLGFQRRRFLEVLQSGEKLFVFHDFGAASVALGRAILQALRRHGPNALLLVSAGDRQPSGTVERIEGGFYLGHIAAFAPVWAADRGDLSGWMSVCGNAYRLWREEGFGG